MLSKDVERRISERSLSPVMEHGEIAMKTAGAFVANGFQSLMLEKG